jgi:hypothetical protein
LVPSNVARVVSVWADAGKKAIDNNRIRELRGVKMMLTQAYCTETASLLEILLDFSVETS